MASVTRGADDRQAVMTFAQHYPEWRGMFAGNTMLPPKSTTANPDVFNKGQLDKPGPSAGPFMVTSVDRTAQRITLSRDPKWWGTAPLLDTITFIVLDDAGRIPALLNKTIDATGIASLDELKTVERDPDDVPGRPARRESPGDDVAGSRRERDGPRGRCRQAERAREDGQAHGAVCGVPALTARRRRPGRRRRGRP